MKKTFIRLFGIILLGCLVVVALRLFTPEDTRICDNGQRTMHGNPSSPMPIEACEGKINSEELWTNVGMANPASVYCKDNWWTLEIVDTAWGQVWMCTLSDGTVCEERAYMRHECPATTPGKACTEEAKVCPDGSAVGRTWPNCEFAPCPEETPTICTMEYAPVCASIAIQCIKAPCDPVEQTFWNRCQMNANKLATFLHEGECK